MKWSNSWILALLLVSAPALKARTAPVRIAAGRVEGISAGGNIVAYEGIPFAAPPVGRLRWRPPQPVKPWKGILHASHFGPSCMQDISRTREGPWTRSFLTQSTPNENCLYLNVWAPAHHRGRPLPVFVWIYGGGFTSGSTDLNIYNGANLARTGLVVVSVAYRVGPLGFLALPALTRESGHHSSGNYGLLDQIAGLRWVRNNIAVFGGDPHHVTIFGQSAGAYSVDFLLQSPLARGLFQAAIIMSGPPAIDPLPIGLAPPLAAAEKSGTAWETSLGVHSLAQLRALPAQRLLRGDAPIGFAPIADGWVLPQGPRPLDAVPVMNGMVANDIHIGYYGFGPPPKNTPAAWRESLTRRFGAEARRVLELYPANSAAEVAHERKQLLRDRAKVALSLWAARQEKQEPKVYIYYFDRKLPWPRHPEFGAFHSAEIPYAFNNLGMLNRPFTNLDYRIANQDSTYWADFAKAGDPNTQRLPFWHTYDPQHPGIMELGPRTGWMPLTVNAERLDFWRSWLQKTHGY